MHRGDGTAQAPGGRDALLRALVLMYRYTVDITHIAASTLGHGRTSNTDVHVMLAIHRAPGSTPGQLGSAMGLAGTATSRAIGHLVDEGLVERRPSAADARSSLLHLTRAGRARVARFDRALDDCFAAGAPSVKEVLSILAVAPVPGRADAGRLDAAIELSRAGSAFADEVDAVLTPYGANDASARFTVALLLDRGQLRPGHLAHDLDLSTSGTSDLLDRLETAGAVRRSHDDADRRAVVVRLTARGDRAANEQLDVFATHAESLCQALSHTLPAPMKELA